MGSWYMNLSDYMGGRCLWKFNSIGGGVKKKCLLPTPGIFFWNSPHIQNVNMHPIEQINMLRPFPLFSKLSQWIILTHIR